MKQTFRHLAPVVTGLVVVAVVIVSLLAFYLPQDEDYEITVVLKSLDEGMEFWEIVRAGIETASQEHDVSPVIVGPSLEREISEQVRIMHDVVADRPDGIILAASDYEALSPLVDEAVGAGIEVITIDSGVASEAPASFIATDNLRAGEKAGRRIGELVGSDGRIAIVSHIEEVATAIDRERGVVRGFEQTAPDGEVIETVVADNVTEIAYEQTLHLLKQHPSLDGLVALNEKTTIGAAWALRDANAYDSVQLVGFDHSQEEISLMEEGIIDALVVQKPFNMGYLGITNMVRSLEGETVDSVIDTGSELIDRDNMYTPENQRLLFPFAESTASAR